MILTILQFPLIEELFYIFFVALHISALCHLTMKWLTDLIINTSLEAWFMLPAWT